jgi:Lon-like protease
MPDDSSVSAPIAEVPPSWPGDPSAPDGGGPPPRGSRRWMRWFVGVTAVLVAAALAGFVVHLPYYSLSPGGTLPLAQRVQVKGATTYPRRGDFRLLYVRERPNVNVWQWLQASLDPDIDLVKRENVTGGQPLPLVNLEDQWDMASAKLFAQKVAMQAAGYTVKPLDGVSVFGLVPGEPAAKVLQANDVVEQADGRPLRNAVDLTRVIGTHHAGDKVRLVIRRKGKLQTVDVGVVLDNGRPVIGILTLPRYQFPVQVNIDTTGISGPSAGLAMTLAILDDLTPGNLTGGKRVAVTGTISPDGRVGEIGAIDQKAVTARRAGAKLFLVPSCSDPNFRAQRASCEKDLRTVATRAGKGVKVVPVANVAEALRALHAAGGDPVTIHPIS